MPIGRFTSKSMITTVFKLKYGFNHPANSSLQLELNNNVKFIRFKLMNSLQSVLT